MPRFLYASPILPGKTDLVRQVYAHKKEHPELDQETQQFNTLIGLEGWQAWLQRTPTRDYFIHGIETKSLEELFYRLQDQIQSGHHRAQWLRDFYLDVFGKDYGHHTAIPEVETLFSMDIPTLNAGASKEIYSRGFTYPIRPNKVHEHREFSRQCAGEYRYRLHDACRLFGITKTARYLQKTPHQDYLVIYQEYEKLTPEQEKNLPSTLANHQSWQWLGNILSAHTGLSMDKLEPNIEPLTRQPLVVAHGNPWKVATAALR